MPCSCIAQACRHRKSWTTCAAEGNIDLIVMATHGRGGVARLMMGSVADKIVRGAPCPVLTLRQSDESAAHASHAA